MWRVEATDYSPQLVSILVKGATSELHYFSHCRMRTEIERLIDWSLTATFSTVKLYRAFKSYSLVCGNTLGVWYVSYLVADKR